MRTWRAGGATRAMFALTGALLLSLVGLIAPARAAADDPVALVSITLTSIKPALPKRDGTITLSGTVTNISGERLFRLQADFWRNQAPVAGREGIDAALASAANDPIGARYSATTGSFDDLYDPGNPYMEPGKSAHFSVTAPIAGLALSPTPGIYLMGVHVLQNGVPIAIGRARVFVPVLDAPPAQSLKMTSVVVLNSRPALLGNGVFADDHLATEVAPTGRLTALLKAAGAPRTSFAVDPALIEELEAMRAGYQVRQRSGELAKGEGDEDATRWLSDFAALKSSGDGYRMLYGSPDIAALVHDGQTAVLKQAVQAGERVDATDDLPPVILPAAGAADTETLAAARALDPDAVILADTSARSTGPLLDGGGRAPVVSFTSTAYGGGPGPEPSTTAVQLQQRMLAETWLEATSATDGSAHGRVRLITTATQARSDDGGVRAPWLEPSTLADLLDTTPAAWDEKPRYADASRAAELTLAQLGALRRLSESEATYAGLLVDGDAAKKTANSAVARASSWAWRNHPRASASYTGPLQADLDDLLTNKVVISSNAKVSTTARDGVYFPITVRNLLPGSQPPSEKDAIRLKLVFTSDNPQRMTIKTIDFPSIAAQDSQTANAEVTAKANGIVPVVAQLQTAEGEPVGKPFLINVEVTQNGTVGWAIVIGSGLVLVGSTVLRIRQVSRDRARAAAQLAAAHRALVDDPLASAPPTDAAAHDHTPADLDV